MTETVGFNDIVVLNHFISQSIIIMYSAESV